MKMQRMTNNRNNAPRSPLAEAEIVTMDNNVSNSEADLRGGEEGDKSTLSDRYRRLGRSLTFATRFVVDCTPPPCLYHIILGISVPIFVWTLGFLVLGDSALPHAHSPLFGLFFMEFAGIGLGYLASLLRLPPLLGMLIVGLLMRNNALLDFGNEINAGVSATLRQIALVIILIRAGLGLDSETLLRLKGVVIRLTFLPCLFEAFTLALVTHLLLDFPFLWGLLLGFIFAAVSPAIIVPCLLDLKEKGYGMDKGISTIVIAASSCDDILAISLFGITLGFVLSSGESTMSDTIQGPLEFALGASFGVVYGYFNGTIFSKSDKEGVHTSKILRVFFTIAGGILSVFGFQFIKYPGAGALACLSSTFVASLIWKRRGVSLEGENYSFAFLWHIFQPMLFGLIGREVDIDALEGRIIGLGIICTCIGLSVRSLMTFLVVCKSGFNFKEKIFITLSWLPKATVQAALGPIALDTVRHSTTGQESEDIALKVLGLSVLVILLTAPIGAILISTLGPILLKRGNSLNPPKNRQNCTGSTSGFQDFQYPQPQIQSGGRHQQRNEKSEDPEWPDCTQNLTNVIGNQQL